MIGLGLTLTALGRASGEVPPDPVEEPYPLPATLDGSVGNKATFPHTTMMQGPNSGLYAIGPVLDTGEQAVRIYTAATGELLETHVVRNMDAKDDHNAVSVVAYPDGSLVAAACGHSNNTDAQVHRRSPQGVWTTETLTYPGTLTYPTLYLDNAGVLWFFVRATDLSWYVRSLPSFDGAWSPAVNYMTKNDGLAYCNVSYSAADNMFVAFVRANSLDADFGILKMVTLDPVTGEWRDKAGGLGFNSGAPSADTGKSLPFNMADVAVFASPPMGRAYDARTDRSTSLIILSDNDTTVQDGGRRSVWKLNGANRFEEADYIKGPALATTDIMSTASNYPMDATFVEQSDGHPRLFIASRNASNLNVLDQWDNPSGDVIRWQKRRINAELGPALVARPISIFGGDERTPVAISSYSSFTDYNIYGTTELRFYQQVASPVRAFRPETEAYIARHQVQPGEAWAYAYDNFINGLIEDGLWPLIAGLHVLSAHDIQASRLNIKGSAYTLTQIGGLPDSAFTAGRGWQGNGTGALDTGFNPSTDTTISSRDSAHMFCVSRTAITENPACMGNSLMRIMPRIVSGGSFSARVNGPTTTTGSSTNNGAGRYFVNRTAANAYSLNYNTGTAAKTDASQAPPNESYKILGNGVETGNRLLGFAGWGAGLTAMQIGLLDKHVRDLDAMLSTL